MAEHWRGHEVEKVRIREDWAQGGHEVYLLARQDGQRGALVPNPAAQGAGQWLAPWLFVTITEGAAEDPGPSIRLPEGALEGLLEQAGAIANPSGAMAAHLTDAIATRQWATGLLERIVAPAPEAPTPIRGAG